jgi:hypothetical protein
MSEGEYHATGGLAVKKHSLFCLVLGILCLALWIGNALAAEGGRPCADDVAKFCKDVKPGGAGLSKCLKEHESELSPECKASITEGAMNSGLPDWSGPRPSLPRVVIGEFCNGHWSYDNNLHQTA